MTEITMPKLSDTMTEGKLIAWKKGIGDRVERGEIIAEVETDKATMELEAFSSGVLLETRVKAGETVQVGTVIGIVGEAGEKAAGKTAPPAEAEAPPGEKPEIEKPEEKGPEEKAAAEAAPEEQAPPESAAEGKASPLVRRLAREQGIDLAAVEGSGPDGRILREDLAAKKAGIGDRTQLGLKGPGTGKEEKSGEPLPSQPIAEGAVQPLSRMRAAIARTVSQAWQTIPHFAVTVEIEMGEAERVREELKGAGTPLSMNDVIIKAAALALEKFPRVNASFSQDGIIENPAINIGFAVSLDDGLLVPVIKGCRELSLKEIAARSRDLAEKAKGGKISEAEISGGTFSISNLGMFGVDEFMAVILPPQGAILAVGAIGDKPVIKGGQPAAARMMRATLSCDHRLLDGAYAAQFLRELKRVLENPVEMLV